MKILKSLFIAAALATFTFAQSGVPINVPSPPAPLVNVGPAGTPGFTPYYYVVVANYASGSAASQITPMLNGNATLSMTNYNQVGWTLVTGALTYDVLQLTTPVYTGSCTCSVATGLSATTNTFSDNGGGTSSYTQAAGAQAGIGAIYLDNIDYAFPKTRVQVSNNGTIADHLDEIWSGAAGATLPAYCKVGDIFDNTSTSTWYGCGPTANHWYVIGGGSGGGGALAIYTSGTGGVTANQLVKLTTTNTVVKTLTSDTAPDIAIGISLVTAAAGVQVPVLLTGPGSCIADTGGITSGDLVGVGTTVADTCVDLGQTLIASVAPNIAVVGRATSTALATAAATVTVFPQLGAGFQATGTGSYVRSTAPVITAPTGIGVDCAATAACPNTARALVYVEGTGTLATGSPSTYAVTAMSPAFTSTTSYRCFAQDTTTIANNIGVLTAGYVSGSAVTFTGPNTNTDTFRWYCVGY